LESWLRCQFAVRFGILSSDMTTLLESSPSLQSFIYPIIKQEILRELWHTRFCKRYHLHREASTNYELITIRLGYIFLTMMSTGINADYLKVVRSNVGMSVIFNIRSFVKLVRYISIYFCTTVNMR
jgi:hypothetical protein